MKKFLFVIPQSPKRMVTPFRQRLIDISMRSLLEQQSSEWEALFLGEEERSERNLHFLKCPVETKEEKLHFAVDYLLAEKTLPEYIIRFDDDDIINPEALMHVGEDTFDCYADKLHKFYDASTGRVSNQKRDWLPNTIIHKAEHALAVYGEYHHVVKSDKRRPHLLQNDHSKWWHKYYAEKKVAYASGESPLYLRILSPTSFTANSENENADKVSYTEYLSRFGDWEASVPKVFGGYVTDLKNAWLDEMGPMWDLKINKQGAFGLNRLFGKKKD